MYWSNYFSSFITVIITKNGRRKKKIIFDEKFSATADATVMLGAAWHRYSLAMTC
jgi:hypothetical protein